jgi:uncharacterized protein YbbK (DUF523 family)
MRHKVFVSACLLGRAVRYNGTARLSGHPILERWLAEGRVVALCPEVAAGFATPRPPAEITAGRQGEAVWAGDAQVIEQNGADVTALYEAAGRLALDLAQAEGCRHAVLTDGSPSCGSSYIYDGSFTGVRQPGRGTTAALLNAHGIAVYAESQITELDMLLAELERLPLAGATG